MSSFTILVDDTDSRIQYYDNAGHSGGWAADSSGSLDKTGYTGLEYNHTLHTPSLSGASFAFPFTGMSLCSVNRTSHHICRDLGSSVSVFGIITASDVNPSNLANTWSCFVDQIPIPSFATTPLRANTNTRNLCLQNQIADGPHMLTVNVSATSTALVNVDGITYTTSDAKELDSAVAIVTNTDPSVVYGTGWSIDNTSYNAPFNQTTTIGSKVSLLFNGQ